MPPATRVGDPTVHGGIVTGPGVATVLVGGMPAAVAGDLHTCAIVPAHPPTPFPIGSPTVLVGGRPFVRVGDVCGCGATAAAGFPTVVVG